MFGAGTLDRPWLAGARPDGCGADEDGGRVRVPRQARRALLLLPRSRRRAPGRQLRASSGPTSTRSPMTRLGYQERDRRPAPVGHGQPVHPPALPGRRRHEPGSRRSSPTLRPRSRTCWRSPSAWAARTTSCGAAARATTPCSTPTCGARASSSPGSCTSSRSTRRRSASRARSSSSPSRWSPPSTSTTTTRRPCTASSSGTGSRASTRSTSRPTTPRSPATRFHHEVAYAVAHGILGSHRRQPRRPAERLGHGPVPELRRGPGDAALRDPQGRRLRTGGFNFDAKLRRQSIDRNDLFHAHIGGIDTLARALLVAADMLEDGDAGRHGRARATRAGRAAWGGRSSAGALSLADLAARVEAGEIDPRPRERPAGAVRERGQPAPLASRLMAGPGVVLGIDVVDHRDQGRPRRPGWPPALGSRPASTGSTASPRSGPSSTRSRGGRATVTAIGRSLAAAGPDGAAVAAIGLTGQMHGLVLLDGDDGLIRPAILWNDQRTGAECDANPRGRRSRAADPDHGQRRADRLHRAQARSGSVSTSPRPGRGSDTCSCPRTSSGSG